MRNWQIIPKRRQFANNRTRRIREPLPIVNCLLPIDFIVSQSL